MMMKLWPWALLMIFCHDGIQVDSAIDYSSDPEMEALQYVFGPDDAKHTGPERLKWHLDHLKWTTQFLSIMNLVKNEHQDRIFINKMNTYEGEWIAYDAMRRLNQIGEDTGLKYDIFEGDSFVIGKYTHHIEQEVFTHFIVKDFQEFGPDFLKYVVQNEEFGYIIKDPKAFAAAVYEFGDDPVALADEVGMTLPQLRMLDEALEKAMLPRSEYWDQPILILEIAMEMCKLSLLDHCIGPITSVFDETKD